MEELVSFEQAKENIALNQVIVNAEKSSLNGNSKITFFGKNNILFVEDGVCLRNSTISFQGDNAVVYLSRNRHTYFLRITLYHDSAVHIGDDCYINGAMTLVASERQNILLGREGLFSFGIFMRTADPHLLYDCETKRRINASRSVLIGDHVWIGQNALILKGTQVGSGSVIGGDAVLSGKKIISNAVACGNPARVIRRNIFFSSECVHKWTREITEKYEIMDTDRYIYHADTKSITLEQIDAELKDAATAEQRLERIQRFLADNKEKDRFAIEEVK